MLWLVSKLLKYQTKINTFINPLVYNHTRYMSTHVNKQKPQFQKNNESTKCSELAVNLEVEGFKVIKTEHISDFHCTLIQLKHIKTGAEYVHIDRNDYNNVFAISFRTTPFNSTGLPHILEHITLCGSNKYPCRDPFFKMLNRSLATFMNAMTGPDYTVYPFSTQNRADYYNLMSVYLDAVFKPQLRESDFKQEGWRLEHEDIYNPKSPIVFKGVVFNEMKGVFSENQSIFIEHMLNNILPSHTYGFVSGGDPLVIPQLTHQDLINFHNKYYHPSNAKIYSYGNLNLIDHLKFINEVYLKNYEGNHNYSQTTQVPLEPRWSSPKKKHVVGRFDPLAPDKKKQSVLAAGFLCEDICNVEDNFLLKVLSRLLIEGPNSSFYKSLIESNIGTDYAPGTGFDSQTRDTMFVVGLQGISSENFDKVEEVISDTFQKAIEIGFDEKNVESILHSMELGIKHQQSDFGLDLLLGSIPLWNHDGDLVKMLGVTNQILQLRENIKENQNYLQESVERYFKSNTHNLILTMSPDQSYEENMKSKESALLQTKLSNLSDTEKNLIYEHGIILRKEQEKKENLSCLPTLKISDIKRDISKNSLNNIYYENVPVQISISPTNGISYFRGIINTSQLPEELKSILPLFNDTICKMGTNKNDYRNFDQLVYLKTGGLNVNSHIGEDINSDSHFEEGILLNSHCLDRNAGYMFNLWNEIFNEVCLDNIDRFSTLVRVLSGDLLTDVASSGHCYAMLSASSLVNSCSYQKELLSGLTYIYKLKKIAQMNDLSPILNQIKEIANHVMCKKHLRCSLNLSPENESSILSHLSNTINNISGSAEKSVTKSTVKLDADSSDKKHYIFPFAVNYTGKSLPSVPFISDEYATLKVLCRLLTTKYLLPLVREKYGAYGAGVNISPAGVLQFYSYRDPNSVTTFDIFDGADEWIQKNEFTNEDIDEAKLGIFQNVDMPIPPNSTGMRLFLHGISDDVFINYRHNLLSVNRENLLNASSKYISYQASENLSGKVIIGPENVDTKSWNRIS